MSYHPAIRAVVAERLIFNYRLPVAALREMLPAVWLEPQEVSGYAVASFCALDLRNITFAPMPAVLGFRSISCAPRYAVCDISSGAPCPAVYVNRRYTSSAFGSWLTRLSCIAPHPHAPASITREGRRIALEITAGKASFQARVKRGGTLSSRLFNNADAFAGFISQGVTSYGRCSKDEFLTRIDLAKTDSGYEPLDVLAVSSPIVDMWERMGGVLDSAFRTTEGLYEWTYLGLRPMDAKQGSENNMPESALDIRLPILSPPCR